MTSEISVPLLGIFGNEDQAPTPEQVDQSEEALKAWMDHPNHMLDGFGSQLTGPADSEYFKKYKDAPDYDSRPVESDRYEVVPNP